MSRLVIDVVERIVHHARAMQIQRCVRRHAMRHVRTSAWRQLRAALCGCLDPGGFDLLQRNQQIRTEWRTEPESWLFSDEPVVRIIVTEVASGMWDPRPVHSPADGRRSSAECR